jgi:hypothetical protein
MSDEKEIPTPPPLVLVVWEDAKVIGDNTWLENKKREYVPHLFYQTGFLTLDDVQGIHVVSTWHPDLVSQPDQIPRAMIRSITALTPQKPTQTKGTRNARTKSK